MTRGRALLAGAVVLVAAVLLLRGCLPAADDTAAAGARATTATTVATATAATRTAATTPSVARTAVTRTPPPAARTAPARTTTVPRARDLRSKALAVLAVVDDTGRAPDGYVGGRRFMNDGRGGTAPLPRTDRDGRVIVYHEYDVNPRRQGVDRGPQRLVVGDDGSAWATPDHYDSWLRLR